MFKLGEEAVIFMKNEKSVDHFNLFKRLFYNVYLYVTGHWTMVRWNSPLKDVHKRVVKSLEKIREL